MSLCIIAAGKTTMLAASAFTLIWTHSVERVAWQEDWRVTEAGLELLKARIKGSGAGMEPPDGAVLAGGWWHYEPEIDPVPELHLATSAAAGSWLLCTPDECLTLANKGGDGLTLARCSAGLVGNTGSAEQGGDFTQRR